MKISERAKMLIEALDQIGRFDNLDPATIATEDQALLKLAEGLLNRPPFQPRPQQERSLQSRLAQLALQANPQQAARQRQRYHSGAAMRVVGAVALLAVFSLFVVFLFQNIAPQPETDISQPLVLANTTPSPIVTMVEQIVPKNLAVVPDACEFRVEDTSIDTSVYNYPLPQSLVGGGSVKSGDFQFELWLACDPRYTSDISNGADDFSELNGLGLFAGWSYDGKKEDGTMWDFSGFEPFVQQSSGSSPVAASLSSFVERGIQFARDIIPDFSKQETNLRYIYFTQLPSGGRNGAALTFTLQREAEGYRPVDITVSALSAEELQNIENQDLNNLPFATRSPIDEFPQIAVVRQKLTDWESSLLSPAGWLYIKNLVKDSGGNMLYGGIHEYIDEGWYQLDSERRAVRSINQTRTLDGRILQQSTYNNDVGFNLTMGTSYQYSPTPMSLINSLISRLTSQARTGQDWQPQEATWQGKTVWVFSGKDTFDEPLTLDAQPDVIAVEGRSYVDPLSGALLGDETYVFTVDGQQRLSRSSINQTTERIEQPPAEMMALLQNPPPLSYAPPQAQGEPPPADFDLGTAKLTLNSYPGDDFNMPTFWVGDIYADDYLLGRLDFGAVPGGRCQRSSDGNTIAYLYEVHSNERLYSSQVAWVSLNDLSTVHKPAEQIEATGSSPSWSPSGSQFVFSGCHVDGTPCGIYRVDISDQSFRLLSTAATSAWPIIWNPDGSQLAVVDTRDDQHRFYVIDTTSGASVYEGFFNADNWQIPAESPAASWGVRIPHNSGEESGCFK